MIMRRVKGWWLRLGLLLDRRRLLLDRRRRRLQLDELLLRSVRRLLRIRVRLCLRKLLLLLRREVLLLLLLRGKVLLLLLRGKVLLLLLQEFKATQCAAWACEREARWARQGRKRKKAKVGVLRRLWHHHGNSRRAKDEAQSAAKSPAVQ